jgi:hypothetical protein
MARSPESESRLVKDRVHAEGHSRGLEVPQVERHEEIRLPVDRRLEDHIVLWIRQSRPPQERQSHGLTDQSQRIQHIRYHQTQP